MADIIRPRHETLELEGEMSYKEGQKAWSVIRLKKDILKEFPQLKERREKFSYKMIMHRTFEDLKKAIGEMEREKVIPIFLFFRKR